MKTIDAGKFDRYATLSTRTPSTSAVGGLTFTVTQYAEIWTMFIPKSGSEQDNAERKTSARKAEFWAYYNASTQVSDVITLDGEQWDITYIDPYPQGYPRYSIMKMECELIK